MAFGLATTGAVAGFGLTYVVNIVESSYGRAFGLPVKMDSPAKVAITGAFAGAVLGLGIGSGIDYLNGDEVTHTAETCFANLPEGKTAVLDKDDLGNPVCAYIPK